MRKTRCIQVVLLICAAVVLNDVVKMVGPQSAWGDEPNAEIKLNPIPEAVKLDVTKGRIEGPLKDALAIKQAAEELAQQARAKEKAERKPADRGKALIELGAKRLVQLSADEAPAKLTAQARPGDIEKPQAIEPKAVNDATPEKPFAEEKIVADNSENPKVEPGKVQWHADFAAACQASQQSGKPVFLFQLLGQLDQRFT